MSDYLAKEMFGEKAVYAVGRIAFTGGDKKSGMVGLWGGGMLRFPVDPEIDADRWQIMDCEIYIKPIRKEEFKGSRGMRIDQVLNDVHFSHAFGELEDKE